MSPAASRAAWGARQRVDPLAPRWLGPWAGIQPVSSRASNERQPPRPANHQPNENGAAPDARYRCSQQRDGAPTLVVLLDEFQLMVARKDLDTSCPRLCAGETPAAYAYAGSAPSMMPSCSRAANVPLFGRPSPPSVPFRSRAALDNLHQHFEAEQLRAPGEALTPLSRVRDRAPAANDASRLLADQLALGDFRRPPLAEAVIDDALRA